MGEFSPLPALAVGILGILIMLLAIGLGVLQFSERSIFSSIALVMLLVAALTFLSIHSAFSEPEKCEFESGE